jgi:hypothetical protein
MRTLTSNEVEQVSGGNPLAPLFWGVAGAYAYDALGGYEGINSGITGFFGAYGDRDLQMSLLPY